MLIQKKKLIKNNLMYFTKKDSDGFENVYGIDN